MAAVRICPVNYEAGAAVPHAGLHPLMNTDLRVGEQEPNEAKDLLRVTEQSPKHPFPAVLRCAGERNVHDEARASLLLTDAKRRFHRKELEADKLWNPALPLKSKR